MQQVNPERLPGRGRDTERSEAGQKNWGENLEIAHNISEQPLFTRLYKRWALAKLFLFFSKFFAANPGDAYLRPLILQFTRTEASRSPSAQALLPKLLSLTRNSKL